VPQLLQLAVRLADNCTN